MKPRKSEKELVNDILKEKRKVQIRALYSSAELESKRANLQKRKMTLRSNSTPKQVKVKLALKSQIRESPPKPKQVKQTKKDSQLFRMVEMKVKTKFELLFQSKDKEIREEREKNSNLQNDKDELQKDIDDRNLRLENLKKLIVPMNQKLEDQKKWLEMSDGIERELKEEIRRMKTMNDDLREEVDSLKVKKSFEKKTEDVLRDEITAQKKKIEDMIVEERKHSKEMNAKNQSLKERNSKVLNKLKYLNKELYKRNSKIMSIVFTLKKENYRLKKDQNSKLCKIKDELAEVQKSSKRYESINEKYKSDNEESGKIIRDKEEEIKKLKGALEKAKKNQASSSKRKQKDEINTKSKRKKTEDPPPVSGLFLDDSTDSIPDTPDSSFSQNNEPAPGSLIAFIDSFSASLSSSRDVGPSEVPPDKSSETILGKSMPNTIDDLLREENIDEDAGQELTEKTEESDENRTATEKGSSDIESSLRTPSYSPAKTSIVVPIPITKQLIKIRNMSALLQNGGEEETRDPVKRIDFERMEDTQDSNFALKFKKYFDKDVKAVVEKCMNSVTREHKINLSKVEYNDLSNMFVKYFTEKIRSNHLQRNPTEKGLEISNEDKTAILDTMYYVYFPLVRQIHEYITPFELKVRFALNINQKDFLDLKRQLVNELFRSVQDTWQDDVISGFHRLDKSYQLGHVFRNPEKNRISKEWLIKRFVDHSLGVMGCNLV